MITFTKQLINRKGKTVSTAQVISTNIDEKMHTRNKYNKVDDITSELYVKEWFESHAKATVTTAPAPDGGMYVFTLKK